LFFFSTFSARGKSFQIFSFGKWRVDELKTEKGKQQDDEVNQENLSLHHCLKKKREAEKKLAFFKGVGLNVDGKCFDNQIMMTINLVARRAYHYPMITTHLVHFFRQTADR
jgi:hypothetical protein